MIAASIPATMPGDMPDRRDAGASAKIIPFRRRAPTAERTDERDVTLNAQWDRLLAMSEQAWSRRDAESLEGMDDLVGWLLQQTMRDWSR